jgi:AraC-like DNA-binding protein
MPREDAKIKEGFIRYLTYSAEDEKWQLVCTDAGFNEIGPRTPYPPHKDEHPTPFRQVAVGRTLNEYQIIYITEGKGNLETGGRTYALGQGSLMVIFPGKRHVYKPDFETGWKEYWVGFKGPAADKLVSEGFLSPERPVFKPGLQNGILSIYESIFEYVRNQGPLYQIRASSRILALIAEVLADERLAAQHSHSERLVEGAKFLMEENIYGEINLNGMGEKLGVSTSHLNEVFKAYTSMTPYQYFIHIKIHKAKELLEEGGFAVKEVAYRLGFKDEYYFSRLFKKKTGLSPSKWNPRKGGV